MRRHWLLVAVVTLAVVAVAAVTTLRSSPTYKASAKILVSPIAQGETSFANIGVVQESGEPVRTVQTAAALVDSLAAAQLTAARLGHGWTASGVQDAVSVTPLGESDVLNVTAETSPPGEAALLADTFARTAVNYARDDRSTQHQRPARCAEDCAWNRSRGPASRTRAWPRNSPRGSRP